jgi:hypothetical protein
MYCRMRKELCENGQVLMGDALYSHAGWRVSRGKLMEYKHLGKVHGRVKESLWQGEMSLKIGAAQYCRCTISKAVPPTGGGGARGWTITGCRWAKAAVEPFRMWSRPGRGGALCLKMGADLVCTAPEGTDPNGANKTPVEAAALSGQCHGN